MIMPPPAAKPGIKRVYKRCTGLVKVTSLPTKHRFGDDLIQKKILGNLARPARPSQFLANLFSDGCEKIVTVCQVGKDNVRFSL